MRRNITPLLSVDERLRPVSAVLASAQIQHGREISVESDEKAIEVLQDLGLSEYDIGERLRISRGS